MTRRRGDWPGHRQGMQPLADLPDILRQGAGSGLQLFPGQPEEFTAHLVQDRDRCKQGAVIAELKMRDTKRSPSGFCQLLLQVFPAERVRACRFHALP